MSNFTHLHTHSMFSVYDGLGKVEDLIDGAKAMGFSHIALTDHGKMGGIVRAAQRAVEPDSEGRTIEFIVGCEAYICDGSMMEQHNVERDNGKIGRPRHYHSTMLASNEKGYNNLVRMMNIGNIKGFYYDPRVDMETVEAHNEGIICTSGCMSGQISRAILADDEKRINTVLDAWHQIFGDRFYLEVQNHGIPEQLKIAKGIFALSKKHNIPVVATNDVHYLTQNDSKAHTLLKQIQAYSRDKDDQESIAKAGYSTDQFYLKSTEEMYALWSEHPEACRNTMEVAERCAYRYPVKNNWQCPTFVVPYTDEFSGFKEFWNNSLPKHNEHQAFLYFLCVNNMRERGLANNDEYRDRLKYELKIIFEMGVEDYFLIIWDVFRHVREQNIAHAPGRGSGAGSLVLYLTEVTMIDPLDKELGLMFERFLNPGRSSTYEFGFSEFTIVDWKKWKQEEGLEDSTGKLRLLVEKEAKESDIPGVLPNVLREILPLENQELDTYYYDLWANDKTITKNNANSWIAYMIGITPEQPTGELKVKKMGSLPDVDSDFDTHRRDEIYEYLKQTYGRDKVVNIGTYGIIQARSALRGALKSNGYSQAIVDELAKLVPDKFSLAATLELEIFKTALRKHKIPKELIDTAVYVEGAALSHISEHAGGIVISPHSLTSTCPLHKCKKGVVSQLAMNDLEAIGLIKFDMLATNAVSKMQRCIDMINARTGGHETLIDWLNKPRNNPKALNVFKKGYTQTIFQFQSFGIRQALREIGADSFCDLVAVNAMYRPGPMRFISKAMYENPRNKKDSDIPWAAGMTYAENKKNPGIITYIHPDLEPIMKDTYGILCYQEQSMEMARVIGGFTLAQADTLRKAIGKKKGDLFEICRKQFFEGAKKKGYEEETIAAIWKLNEDFASYSFNKSHATAYAMIAYTEALMLTQYPYEWYAAALQEENNEETRAKFLAEAIDGLKLGVVAPDINRSGKQCEVRYKDGKAISIVLPLSFIKGIGEGIGEEIAEGKPYATFKDFCLSIKPSGIVFPKLSTGYQNPVPPEKRARNYNKDNDPLKNIYVSALRSFLENGSVKMKMELETQYEEFKKQFKDIRQFEKQQSKYKQNRLQEMFGAPKDA